MKREATLSDIEAIASAAHHGQFRRDGQTPYIEHPKAVVSRLTGDTTAQAVAWLHDVLEDTSETVESLREQGISEDILEAVQDLTKDKRASYEEYLNKLTRNPLAKKVKIADMLSNLADAPTERQIRKYAKALLFLLD